jgi:hypothetical protein
MEEKANAMEQPIRSAVIIGAGHKGLLHEWVTSELACP